MNEKDEEIKRMVEENRKTIDRLLSSGLLLKDIGNLVRDLDKRNKELTELLERIRNIEEE